MCAACAWRGTRIWLVSWGCCPAYRNTRNFIQRTDFLPSEGHQPRDVVAGQLTHRHYAGAAQMNEHAHAKPPKNVTVGDLECQNAFRKRLLSAIIDRCLPESDSDGQCRRQARRGGFWGPVFRPRPHRWRGAAFAVRSAGESSVLRLLPFDITRWRRRSCVASGVRRTLTTATRWSSQKFCA